MTDNHAPPGAAAPPAENRPRVHVKLPRLDYDAAKSGAEAAGVTVPVYLAGLIQADRIDRARGAAHMLHAIAMIGGDDGREWIAEADRAVDVAVRFE